MSTSGANGALNDQEFLFARFDDYNADALNPTDSERFRRLLQDTGNQELVEDTKRAIGMFQLGLQSYFLNDTQRSALQDIVEDTEIRKTREAKRLEQLSRWEALADFRKRLVIVLIAVGVIFAAVYYFTPAKKQKFDALQSLVYESSAMETKSIDDFDLPTKEPAEIASFFSGSKGLEFSPAPLKKLAEEWVPDGAKVIDYEPAKILTVRYLSSVKGDRFYYYNYQGTINELPKATPVEIEGDSFYAYATEDYNIVCWQISDDVVGMIVGKRSARDLAEIARSTKG